MSVTPFLHHSRTQRDDCSGKRKNGDCGGSESC